MNRSRGPLLAFVAMLAAMLALPAAAQAANAYNQTFAGQAACMRCHEKANPAGAGWQVKYAGTAHDALVVDVGTSPAALIPAATSNWWPSASFGTGLRFMPSDLKLMIGAPGKAKEYVSRYRNDGPHAVNGVLVGPIAGPADDLWLFDPITWEPEGTWGLEPTPTGLALYFQRCGGCHNLGLTRPAKTDYPLASGDATMTHSTETTVAEFGIRCENCHGTGRQVLNGLGEPDGHFLSGVDIVGTKRVMESQTCGQCHATMTAKERNYLDSGSFSSPNGFSTEHRLEDFLATITGSEFIWRSPNDPKPVIPSSNTKLFPNGANKGMGHVYYNEWMISPHSRSLRWPDGTLFDAAADDSCLPCHSGEGFLKSLGYGGDPLFPNEISVTSTVASSTLDVECSVCHTVHSKTGDALGLRLPGGELCERCHNAGVVEDGDVFPATHSLSTNKEMIEGYGMVGVKKAGQFMEGAECPDCHMPETRTGRITHSFKPMLPGNAVLWNVRAGGDSCTPCHTSMTREDLQTKIDRWTVDVAGAMDEATRSVAAAGLRAAASTAAGQELLWAARANVDFVKYDRSGGVHNYPYAMDGLAAANRFADAVGGRYALFGATSFDARSGLAMVYGNVVGGDGEPMSGFRVLIEAKAGGTSAWLPLGTAYTTSSGDFTFAVAPAGTTAYRAKTLVLAGADPVSGIATVTRGSSTRAYLSASRIALGRSVYVRGSVSPGHSGRSVTIRYRLGSGSWRTLAVRTLSSSSTYSVAFKPGRRGTYYVRTTFAGDASHLGSTSATVSLKVY